MFDRLMVSLGAFLICAGSTFAQAPPLEPSSAAPGLSEAQPTPIGPSSVEPSNAAPAFTVEQRPFSILPDSSILPRGDGNFWVSGDFVAGFMHGASVNPLVTTAPADTARTTAGVLGAPGANVLFGNDRVGEDLRAGFRLATGYWLNPEKTLGIEAGFMILNSEATHFNGSSNGSSILAVPYTDVNTNTPQAVLVAYPGSSAGSVKILYESGGFYEGHLDLREKALDVGWFRLDSLFGYRFYSYNEGLHIQQNINPTNGLFPAGSQFTTNDDFGTRNNFQGLDMGFHATFVWNTLSLDLLGKMALGNLNSVVNITGNQVATVPGSTPVINNGGLFALPTNIGSYHKDEWWTLPEIGATLTWQVRPNVEFHLGYSLLILNGLVRAGDQVDPVVNPNFFPGGSGTGALRPEFLLRRSDSLIQTINLGMQITY